MRHTSKRPRSGTNLPTVAEGAEQSQEESQQQQQQLQASRSLLSNILTRRSNSQRNNLAASSSASARQNDNGPSGTEAAQGKRKRTLSFLPRRHSSQRSGLTASLAPQHTEADNCEATPVNNDVVAPTSLPSSPTTPRLLGGLSRLPSSASQLCRHFCKTAGSLSNVRPRRRRADADDSHPLLTEAEDEEAMLNEVYPRIEIDDPIHVDGFFRPDEHIKGRAFVACRNKDGDPVVSIKVLITGTITRHVAVVDTNRPFYDVVIGAEGVAKTFFAANGSLSRAEVEQYLSGNHSSLPVKFSVPSTRAVYGRIGLESDVGDDALDGRPTTYVSPPPSMHIQEPRSLVLSRLTPAFVNRFFKNRNAARVHYEVVLRVVWQSSCGSRTMERSAKADFSVQPRAPTAVAHHDHEEGPPSLPSEPTSAPQDVRDVKAILDIIPGRSQLEDYRGRLPWTPANFCLSRPVRTRLLTLGNSQESPRRLTHFFDGRAYGNAAMTLTTDGTAAFVTGEPCPFTFGITLPSGARLNPNDGNLRINVMRTVWTRRRCWPLTIQKTTTMASLQGGSAVEIDVSHSLSSPPLEQHGRPYSHYWSGRFTIEPYMLPAYDFNIVQPPFASRGTRTVPSFSFRGTHVSYDLIVQVDTEVPRHSRFGFTNGSRKMLRCRKSGVLFRINNIPVANSNPAGEEVSEPEATLVPPKYRAPSVRTAAAASTSASQSELAGHLGITPIEAHPCGTSGALSPSARESRPDSPLPAYSAQDVRNAAASQRARWAAAVGLGGRISRPTSANDSARDQLRRQALNNSAANASVRETQALGSTASQLSVFSWLRRETAPTRSQSRASNRSTEQERRITSSSENVTTSSTAQAVGPTPMRPARAADASFLSCATTSTPATLPGTPQRSDEEENQPLDPDGVFSTYHAADETRNTSEMSFNGHSSRISSRPALAPRHDSSTLGEIEPQQADSQSSAAAASTSALLSFELRQSAAVPAPDALPTTPGRSPAIVQQQDQERNRNEEEEAAILPVGEPDRASTEAPPNMNSRWSPETPAVGTPQQQPDQSLSAQPSIVSLGDAAENDTATAETSARVAALPRPPQDFVDAAEAFPEDSAVPAAPQGLTTTPAAPHRITVTEPSPQRGLTAAARLEEGTEVWPSAPRHKPQHTLAPEVGSSREAEERAAELA